MLIKLTLGGGPAIGGGIVSFLNKYFKASFMFAFTRMHWIPHIIRLFTENLLLLQFLLLQKSI